MSYSIERLPYNGNQARWRILKDGEEIAVVSGPMSLGIAAFAARELNANKVFVRGWVHEAMQLVKGDEQ